MRVPNLLILSNPLPTQNDHDAGPADNWGWAIREHQHLHCFRRIQSLRILIVLYVQHVLVHDASSVSVEDQHDYIFSLHVVLFGESLLYIQKAAK